MKKIGYMGFDEMIILNMLENKECQLNFIITQKNRLSKTMFKLLEVMKIPYYIVENKNDLLKYETLYETVDFVLAYCFGIIIPESIISKYKCFNIHPGNLRTNRGPYPLVRNILNNDKEASLTLYRIGLKVDTGIIISEYKVQIQKEDNNITLKEKLDEGLKKLINALIEYKEENKYVCVTDGIYYKKVEEKDILITEKDSFTEMNRKIRAQKSYGGALANYKGYKVRIYEIINKEES